MTKDNRILIYGGYLLAGAAVASITVPSEEAVCLDKRLMCRPPPFHMSDLREDGPQPIRTTGLYDLAFTGSTAVASGVWLSRSWQA